jgi:2-C-methyl-D-erythritol 4-phosphate cytidylyltransferase
MAIHVIIVAGGTGTRMGLQVPKQYLPLGQYSILHHTTQCFVKALPQACITIVIHPQAQALAHEALQHIHNGNNINLVNGGLTRFESVQNGVLSLGAQAGDIVLVHDAARPFVSQQLINNIITTCQAKGNAIPLLPIAESLRIMSGQHSAAVNRNSIKIVQTPQAFEYTQMLKIVQQPILPSFTDEATAAENIGYTINDVPGEEQNIKITTPAQYEWACYLINKLLQ